MLFIHIIGGDGILAVTVFYAFKKTNTVQAPTLVATPVTFYGGHHGEVLSVEWLVQVHSL